MLDLDTSDDDVVQPVPKRLKVENVLPNAVCNAQLRLVFLLWVSLGEIVILWNLNILITLLIKIHIFLGML